MTEDHAYGCPKIIDGKRCGSPGALVKDLQGRGFLKCVTCGHLFGGPNAKLRGRKRATTGRRGRSERR
jgi:Rap1a immunity proteins